MKKKIVVQNPPKSTAKRGGADRDTRLADELRANLKKRKAQARRKSEGTSK